MSNSIVFVSALKVKYFADTDWDAPCFFLVFIDESYVIFFINT